MKYRRVTYEDGHCVKAVLDSGVNQTEIADKVGFHRASISREIQRNSGGKGYRAKQAQFFADERQEYRLNPRKMFPELIATVDEKLRIKWSPEQLCRGGTHRSFVPKIWD